MVVEKSMHVSFDESHRFYPLHTHDDEVGKGNTLKSIHTPNSKAPKNTEDKSDEPFNDVMRD